MAVKWFFMIGGLAFLLGGLYLRELPATYPFRDAWLTFTLIGVFWAGPQLLIAAYQRWKGR